MAERDIGVLCCSLLTGETAKALERLGWDDVPIAAVPGQCHTAGPTQKVEWDAALEELLGKADDVISVCMNCIHRPGNHAQNGGRLSLIDHPRVHVTDTATQWELFLGRDGTEAFLSERAFIVLPGWLRLWRRIVFGEWGFDLETAQEFYRESSSRLLFLDTGLGGDWTVEMEAFSDTVGIPWEGRVVGTIILENLLTLEFERIRAQRLFQGQKDSIQKTRAIAADHAVLVDFLTRLGDVLDRPTIRAQLRETLEILFAPGVIEEETLPPPEGLDGPQPRSSRVVGSPDGLGLDLILTLGDGSRLRVRVGDVAYPEHMDRYLPLARITADAATLALDAARLHLREKDLVTALQEKVKELDSFVYIASHDLQSPLRSVVAFSELLARELGDDLSEDAKTYLGFINTGGMRMRALILSLLALSRTERHTLNLEDANLMECIEGALANLALPMEEAGATVEQGALPRVQADPALITQLYQNLIGNAVKFRAEGVAPRIILSAAVSNGVATLRVADNGIGIDEKFAAQIFEPFRRLHADSEFEGSGIGLSICRKVVERHGGRLWLEPSSEGGACFCFTLPLATGDPPEDTSPR